MEQAEEGEGKISYQSAEERFKRRVYINFVDFLHFHHFSKFLSVSDTIFIALSYLWCTFYAQPLKAGTQNRAPNVPTRVVSDTFDLIPVSFRVLGHEMRTRIIKTF